MNKLKLAGAAALLAIAPVLMTSSADARPGGFHGGGGGFHGGFHGGGFRGGPGFGGGAVHAWNGGGWHGGGWRGHGGWGGRRWIGPGVGFAAGLAAGAALSTPYYYGGYDSSYDDSYAYYPAPDATDSSGAADANSVAYCQQTYRSYDPASGTYLGYDGLRHPCP